MSSNWKTRTEILIGKDGIKKLEEAKVLIYGIGGVGSFAVEGLARAGVGKFILVDEDEIDVTNINRQIHANVKTVGKKKVDVMKERILEINPKAEVETYLPSTLENEEDLIDENITYVIDAVDTITTKLKIIKRAKEKNVQVISAMGAGNKLDPTKFEVSDIYETQGCPLAKIMRKELKNMNIKDLKVVYSKEKPKKTDGKTLRKCFFCTICSRNDNCRRSCKGYSKIEGENMERKTKEKGKLKWIILSICIILFIVIYILITTNNIAWFDNAVYNYISSFSSTTMTLIMRILTELRRSIWSTWNNDNCTYLFLYF